MRYIPGVPATEDDWSTRHSVLTTARRTAALVNVLADERPDPDDVAAVLVAYGETAPVGLRPEDVDEMRVSAALLREVFAAATADEAAALLNRLLSGHTGPLRLTSHAGTAPWHAHVDRDDDAPWAEWLLASSCLALAVLVWDRQRPPGRTCASGSCRNVFIAQGSGPERRYCSRRCATRERVAAHRERQSGGSVEDPV
ncbi:CGNR zinc finger domain-containing protein [Streptomyces sp. NPDC002463]|uniref:CGNR zinc finger domain-containing protein n=1 Tax=Streptomyces sp. NPDC002463 TaxID=3364645 RepID=UPI0036A0615B